MRLPSIISSQGKVYDTSAQISFVSWVNEAYIQLNRTVISSLVSCPVKSGGRVLGKQTVCSLLDSSDFSRTAASCPTQSTTVEFSNAGT